ncbi:MAG: SEC-C domain-containing protein, partial [Alphaproteobacteria bacterium]|nr:SEC-C domain-containing protein [Alphaproteobacteria bacterium]
QAAPDLKFEVLNARYHEREAAIVAQAGVSGAITIATNMAGRGTDIQLGGNPDMKLKEMLKGDESEEQKAALKAKIEAEVAADKEKVLKAGGLYILGTERHESRRIDNQLRGRSGRQGDPGTSKFFLSMQDDLMRIFGSDKMSNVLHRLGLPEGEALVHPWITKALEKAQKKVEERNFDIRKDLLKYDNVMNDQRKIIYEERRQIMEEDDLSDSIKEMRDEYLGAIIDAHIPYGTTQEEWNKDGLKQDLQAATGFVLPIGNLCNEPDIDSETLKEKILNEIDERLKERESTLPDDVVKMVQKSILLQVLDQLWKDHIATLDLMRHTIVLRAYGQRDPLNEYKKEAFNMFSNLLDTLKQRVTVVICHTVIQTNSQERMQEAMDKEQNRKMDAVHNGQVINSDAGEQNIFANVARNDLCPCGSGKKFKHCHGRIVG